MTSAEKPIPTVTLGWRLRMAMEHADIKTDDMARELGVHRGTITRWTHQIGSPPKKAFVQRWADITGVPFGWLAGGDAADNSSSSGRDTHEFDDFGAYVAAA